jgi:hypothetical protein
MSPRLCSCNGNAMQFDPRDATRATLAAMLQSGWGIAPTYANARTPARTHTPVAGLLPGCPVTHARTRARTHAGGTAGTTG